MDWFEGLTGFKERSYDDARDRLQVINDRLHSTANGKSYGIGRLETPSVGELRSRAKEVITGLAGKLAVTSVTGDIRAIHFDAANANALFQVASQFNLLEMTSPEICPEDGVTRYEGDHTQGPACAIAAGAATIYRNYFALVDGRPGQTRDRQINCLRDIGSVLGNVDERLWRMRNGYALCSEQGLATIDATLHRRDEAEISDLRDQLRIGLHWNVEVTGRDPPRHQVSQAFCSALPVAYARIPAERWRAFASLVLEATYEATLWAAVLNAAHCQSRTVFLTRVGGGAFGNERAWIDSAIRRALRKVEGIGLDVTIVSHGQPEPEVLRLVREFA